MSDAKYLQSYVVPVCTFEEIDGQAHTRKTHGTAFLINDWGIFLTAAHVIDDAAKYASTHGLEMGICGKSDGGAGDGSVVARILKHEAAPQPYDVAIGVAPYSTLGPLKLRDRDVAPWQEIATLGYPLSSSIRDQDDAFWMSMKVHRGYVVRTTLPRDMTIGVHPNGIELSFLLSPGMSGSPIFTLPDETIIGVGVGSFESEETVACVEEVDEDGRVFKERRIKIEQFGFAHDLRGLLGWTPSILQGLSLLKASETTMKELQEKLK